MAGEIKASSLVLTSAKTGEGVLEESSYNNLTPALDEELAKLAPFALCGLGIS